MRSSTLALSIIAFIVISPACNPRPDTPEQRERKIQAIYSKVLEQSGGMEGWKLGYHPMIYAAWQYKGRQRADRAIEDRLRRGAETYRALLDDLNSQKAAGGTTLDRSRFLGLIPDETVRQETGRLIGENVPAVHAFARAFIQQIMPQNPDLPNQILILLGKLYTGHPELLDVPEGEQIESDDTRWRDWLQESLAGCGLAGVLTAIDFDHQMDELQKSAQEKFWDGRLSIAYNLRSIQLARAQALEPIMRELEPYRRGGQVGGFHQWMYYDLGWTLHSAGGMFLYTQEEKQRIDEFLGEGLLEGPLGDGEEAKTIADALGRAPSLQEAGRFLGIIDDRSLPCERGQLGYLGLASMFLVPVMMWATDDTSREWLRSRAVSVVEKGPIECGNTPLFKFMEAMLSGFVRNTGPQYPGSLFSDDEMLRIQDAFNAMLPTFTTADDRGSALYLLVSGLVQSEFMMQHLELRTYRDIYLPIYDDWSTTTTFEDAKITQEQFQQLLQDFRNKLGDSR